MLSPRLMRGNRIVLLAKRVLRNVNSSDFDRSRLGFYERNHVDLCMDDKLCS